MSEFFYPLGDLPLLSSILNVIKEILLSFWWIYLPVILLPALYDNYQDYTRTKYKHGLKWTLLELKIPREPNKTPKAMESIFAALHTVPGSVKKWKDKFLQGKVGDWFSFEMVGLNGEIHFYIRTKEDYKQFVQAQIYAHYPGAEVMEVDDYVKTLPPKAPSDQHDITGGEYILAKADAFPILTYVEFEEKDNTKEQDKRIDPLASLVEIFSTLNYGELISIQLLIRSAKDDWVKKGKEEVDKIMGKEPKPKKTGFDIVVNAMDWILTLGAPAKKEEKKEEDKKPTLTPGQTELLKALDRSMGKLGFETGIRYIYLGPKENFRKIYGTAVDGAFKQFASQNLNSFKKNDEVLGAKWPFKKSKEFAKKSDLYGKFREREFTSKHFILNTEELATVYHFPDVSVKSRILPRVEAKKGEPPSGLPSN